MKETILLLTVALFGACGWAQPTIQRWYGTDSIESNNRVIKINGGYLVAGTTRIDGRDDIYVMKMDDNGSLVWQRRYGGNSNEQLGDIELNTDSTVLIAATTLSFGAGSFDMYLLKLDTNGDTLWTRTYGTSTAEFGNRIINSMEGGYLLSGTTGILTTEDLLLVKLDSGGNISWAKTYGGSDFESEGYVIQSRDTGYVVVGRTQSFGAGGYDIHIIKTNVFGDTIWTRTVGGPNNEFLGAVIESTNGDILVTARTESFGAGSSTTMLLRLDAAGNLLWAKTYGGATNMTTHGLSETPGGDLIIGGSAYGFGPTYASGYVVKTNAMGDTLWTRVYYGRTGGLTTIRKIATTGDGGFAMAADNLGLGTYNDLLLMKADSTGRVPCHEQSTATVVGSETPNVVPGSGVSIISLTVTAPASAEYPGQMVLDSVCYAAGLSEAALNVEKAMVFPDPVADRATLKYDNPGGEHYTLKLYDTQGRLVRSVSNLTTGRIPIDKAELSSGLYLFQLQTGARLRFTGRFAIE